MKSLKQRIMISYIGLTLAALLLVGGGLFMLLNRYAAQSSLMLSQSAREQVLSELYSFMQEQPDVGQLRRYAQSLEHIQGVSIELRDAEGRSVFDAYADSAVISAAQNRQLSELLRREPQGRAMSPRGGMMHWGMFLGPESDAGGEPDGEIAEFLDRGELTFTAAGKVQRGTFDITAENFVEQQLIEPVITAFLAAAAAALLAALLLGWRISGSLTRPISQITHTVARMSDGELSARAAVPVRDEELRQLASGIHKMADALQKTIGDLTEEKERLRRFLVDASHELRTPVTALSAYLEMLEGKAGEDPQRRAEYIRTCIAQNTRSREIIVKLLELQRMEQSQEGGRESLDLIEVVEEALTLVKPLADTKGIDVAAQADPERPLVVDGDRYQLVTAVKNIFENALKYSPEGSVIAWSLDRIGPEAVLSVIDEGPGIDRDLERRIFDRFYRAKNAPGSGSGLGLALVQQAAENHAGRAAAANRTDRSGLAVTFTLPLSD